MINLKLDILQYQNQQFQFYLTYRSQNVKIHARQADGQGYSFFTSICVYLFICFVPPGQKKNYRLEIWYTHTLE